jgi:2-polyprenyl-3-methyl-5-hydroxy-6-metoxy-1,4-benzoquinol methylase
MKIALCFSGNIRFLQECYPNIQKYIIDNNDVDVYAHLWWDKSYKGQIFRFHSDHKFEDRDLDLEFIQLYKPKNCIIEIQRKFTDVYEGKPTVYKDEKNNILFGQINYFNQLSQYYSKMKANQLCEESGIKYDLIIHLRIDCVIDTGRFIMNTIQNIDTNQLYMVSTMEGGPKYCGHFPNLPSDWFFMGPPNKINIFTKKLYELLYKYRKYEVTHIQDYISLVLQEVNIPLLLVDSGTSVYRPNTMFVEGEGEGFIPVNHYFDNFDFEKLEWIDSNNKYLPYYAKYINFKKIYCILCNKPDFDIYNNTIRNFNTYNYRVIQCKNCSHIQLFPNNYDVKHYYDDDSQDYEALRISNRNNIEWREMVKNQAFRRLTIIESMIDINNKKIIDIGGGYGDFVVQLSEKYSNSDITILEPGVSRITTSNKANLTKINQLLNTQFSLENKEKYDIVSSFHVLEHVLNPIEFIQNCYNMLKPEGILYIEVPNQNNDLLEKSDYYRNNIWYMKAHISYFTVPVIENILIQLGINKYTFYGFERYDYNNYLNWINENKPQSICSFYNGIPKSNEESVWIENREKKFETDCFYVIIRK